MTDTPRWVDLIGIDPGFTTPDSTAPPSSWRISPDGEGTPTLWDTAGDPRVWEAVATSCDTPAAVWEWLTRVVPALEPEREGDPDVVTATASLRGTDEQA